MIEISTSLQHISSLIELNIANNSIGPEAADDIAAVISLNTNLHLMCQKTI